MAKMGEARKQKLKKALTDWLAERAESFGTIEQLPSGRLRVRFWANDARFSSPHTYDSLIDARAWLDEQRKAVLGGYWTDPRVAAAEEKKAAASSVSVNDLFAVYMEEGDLKPRTRDLYLYQWGRMIEGSIGREQVTQVTPLMVAEWQMGLPTAPRQREQARGLLRAVLNLAIEQGRIVVNPAVTSRRKTKDKRALRRDPSRTFRLTREQVTALAEVMPPKHRFAVLFAAGTGLRFGEMAALQRDDLTILRDEQGAIARVRVHVQRAVTRAKNDEGRMVHVVGPPKTEAGYRMVALPSRLHDELERHLRRYADEEASGLVFPGSTGGYMTPSSVYGERPGVRRHGSGRKARRSKGRGWFRARVEVGVPKARWHVLRHTAISEAVDAGARPADLLARFGHTDIATSEIYQHAAIEADDRLADRL